MQVAQKIRLKPTKSQIEKLLQFSGTARFTYNECLAYKISQYKQGYQTNIQDCIKHIQELKATEEYSWIKETPEAITKQAIRDLDNAYKNFFKRGNKGFPKFKRKGNCNVSFYQRTDNFRYIDSTHIKITGIKEPVKSSKCIIPNKVVNTRVSFDGKYWYLSYTYEKDIDTSPNTEEIIGVDLGIKDLAVCSNGKTYRNINKDRIIKQLEKRKKRLQRQVARKYQLNKQGNKFVKTENIKKLEQKIRLLDRRLSNIRNTYIHTMTKDLVRTKPKAIIIEDLNVSGMTKNRHLAKAIQQQEFRKCRTQLEYKCKLNNIELVVANRYFPSSKRCSCCGAINKDLKLKDRLYHCNWCGAELDRDFNASKNLEKYYEERKSQKAS